MTRTVTHNIDSVVKQLGLIRSRHIPYAARTTVKRLGFKLSRKEVPALMRERFRKPVPFTTGSVFYNAISDYEVEISINRDKEAKKNDPKFYLNPTIPGQNSQAYQTRFTQFLHRGNIVPRSYTPVPQKGNPGMKLNAYGNVKPSEYSRIVSGLRSPKATGKTGRGFRYFSIPDRRNRIGIKARQGSLFDLPQGIYRIKTSGKGDKRKITNFSMLMTYTEKPINVPQRFDYYAFVERRAHEYLPKEFGRLLGRALATARF